MTKEQEDIYHETIGSLMKKLDERDEVIQRLRLELAQLKTRMEGMDGTWSNNH